MPMLECEFEQRPDIRWRKDYAKGADRSPKQQTLRLLIAWCPDRGVQKKRTELSHRFSHKPRAAYASTAQHEFLRLSVEWKQATMHWSSVTRMIAHPNYLRIIGLGAISKTEIVRLLLQELQDEPDHWFAALTAITGDDPVRPEHSFDDAIEAWLNWGHERGLI